MSRDYSLTFTGKKFYPLDPNPDDIDITDIGHALSHICRFGGMVREFYSVAQHCVHAAQCVANEQYKARPHDVTFGPRWQLWALLHDASEAYLGDVVTPLKSSKEMTGYKAIEANVMLAVTQKFNLWPDEPPIVKAVDRRLCATEARDLLITNENSWWPKWGTPYLFTIKPWDAATAKRMFEATFCRLTKEVA